MGLPVNTWHDWIFVSPRLHDLRSAGAINIYYSTISPQQLLNNLHKAHSINVRYSKINHLKLYVENVTRSIFIEDNNVESIEFPFLEYVHGDLFVDNDSDMSLINLPRLHHIHAIEIHDKTTDINIYSQVIWKGESFFEDTTSLGDYSALKERGLKFGLGLRYNTRCYIGL
ncbi:hypothetical protein DSO57_1017713 [Entomophthora muscae]|uniref:Uncharacterized protein n=1 Tax=Entomophthora muscae TaxID=34485 RepID=A0ACC2ST84_9FUNG|nr:hypothetical protein DSO57_1017713 [Entomophthora muscae]